MALLASVPLIRRLTLRSSVEACVPGLATVTVSHSVTASVEAIGVPSPEAMS